MKLILLHGAPAVGKLTVAKALLRLVPGKLFDNHAAMDVAGTVFDFGAAGYWELVHNVRLSVLTAAASYDVPLVVMTKCYADPTDRPAFEQFQTIVNDAGGDMLPVFLHCSKEELVRRVSNADRAERGKITSERGLDSFLAQYNIVPVPHPDCLMLDSEITSADATARQILRHFALKPVQFM